MTRFSWAASILAAVLFAALMPTVLLADEESIRKMLDAYVLAFNKQDAQAVATYWAENAAHEDLETGERTDGREAIVADIKASFEESPDIRLVGQIEHVRMIKPDVAQVDGTTSVGTLDDEAPAVSRFAAILVKQDNQWLIDSIEESAVPQPASPTDALSQLEWMIGRWVDDSDSARVDTTVRWSRNNAFLIRSFSVANKEGTLFNGTEVIGWDPRAKQIRSWKFDSDGSFGDGVWSRSGNDWFIKTTQTLADGSAASGTFVVTPVDENTVKFQLVAHEVEGEPQPSSDPVTVIRVPEAEDTAATEADSSATGGAAAEANATATEAVKPEQADGTQPQSKPEE